MNLRWLFGNFADPQYRLSRQEQRELSDLAHERFTPAWSFVRFTLIALAPMLVGFVVLSRVLAWMGLGGQNGPFMIGVAALCLVFWPWCAWVYRFLYVKPFRRAMRERGYDVCVRCGYWLAGLGPEVGRCPECGGERAENRE